MPSPRLSSRDVPQAPDLDKVRRVVDAVRAGHATRAAIARSTGLSRRHAGYNVAAATRALGFLGEGEAGFALTGLGVELAATVRFSEEERQLFTAAIRESEVLRALAGDLLGRPAPHLDRIVDAAEATGLSPVIAARRAKALLAWREQLLDQPRLSYGDGLAVDMPRGSDGPALASVTIRGFKSIYDARLDLGRFNVFVGANGAGKTNLLEAIGILGCAAAGRVDDEAFQHRGVRPGVPALYKTALRGRRPIPRSIQLESGDGREASYRVDLENPIEKPAPAWRIAHESVDLSGRTLGSRGPTGARLSVGVDTKLRRIELDPLTSIASIVRATREPEEEAAARLLEALTNYAIYTPFTPMLRGSSPDPSPRRPLGLAGGQLAEATRDLFSHGRDARRGIEVALDLIDWARSISVGSPDEAQLSPAVSTKRSVVRFRDRFMVDKRSWLSGFDASEGALYVLFLCVLATHPETPAVVAVDNVDQGLNPRLARALIARVQDLVLERDTRSQMLLTAHSPLVLDALRLKDDRVRLFVVQRAKSGETKVRRLEWSDALEKAEKNGMTLSRLWLSGAIGGMPDL